MVFPTDTVALFIALISGYALYHSASSIPKLQKYEKDAERAAEWSSTAEKRLWDTRYTVGAGFAATILSIVSAAVYMLFVPKGAGLVKVVWPLGLSFGEYWVCRYMRAFWGKKAKIPMLDEYNAAISDTVSVIGYLDVLAFGWGVVAGLKLVGF